MANTTNYGFRWVRSLSGAMTPPAPVRMRLASGLVTTVGGAGTFDLNVGDPVTQLATGYASVAIGSEGTHDLIFGVICGFGYIYNGTRMAPTPYFPSGGGVYGTNYERMSWVYVIPVKDQVFEVDADEGSSISTYANWIGAVGENADHVLTGATSGAVTPLLDISTHNTTAALGWRILDISNERIDNDPTLTRTKVQVVCNMTLNAGSPGTFQTAI